MAWGRRIGLAHVVDGAAPSGAGLRRGPLPHVAVAAARRAGRACRWERSMAERGARRKAGAGSASSRSPAPSAATRSTCRSSRRSSTTCRRWPSDADVAVIVLTGEGGYFVAGTDIAEMARHAADRPCAARHRPRLPRRAPVAEAGDRRGRGLRAGRRLRAGAGLRHDRRGRRRAVRPARDPRRHHARRRRHAAAAARGRALQDAAVVADRRR